MNSVESAVRSSSDIRSKVMELKNLDLEQFRSIVVMHLTRLMDLDGCNLADLIEDDEERKTTGKTKLLFSSRKKSVKEINGGPCRIFGCKLTSEGIDRLSAVIDHLGHTENLQREGIFHLSGNSERQRNLRDQLDKNQLTADLDSHKYTVNDYATVFKTFLGELPEPLLTEKFFNAYCQIAEMKNERKQIECLQLLNHLLPSENARLLELILNLLNKVSLEPVNKRTADNLAIMFTPHLVVSRKVEVVKLQQITKQLKVVVILLINHHQVVFEYPNAWVEDVVRHCDVLSQSGCAKKAGQTLKSRSTKFAPEEDDAIYSVYSFTDQKLTMEAAKQLHTESALADLYEHIHKMPESTQKRKLIKKIDMVPTTPASTGARVGTKRGIDVMGSIRKLMSTKKRAGIKGIFDSHSDPATGTHEEACGGQIATRLFRESEDEEKTDVVFDAEHEEDSTADISSDDGLVNDYFAAISGNETEEKVDEQKLVLQMLEKQNSPNFVRPKGYISLLDIHSGVSTS